MTPFRVVYVTIDTPENAEKLARALVERQQAACVNIVPQIRSIYRWQGDICDDPELLLIIKTHASKLAGIQQTVDELHPYEVAEMIALPITAGSDAYLAWLDDVVNVDH
ncbi:MAG: divalent-cation tolerance protein CutA [Gemmatimonadetes bacterium]|nr:MAG: divalent-cation tolerance protein CutA [Gemmatimonadota bacterium]